MFSLTYDVIMIFVSIAILLYSIFYVSRTGKKDSKLWCKRLNIIAITIFIGFTIDLVMNFFNLW